MNRASSLLVVVAFASGCHGPSTQLDFVSTPPRSPQATSLLGRPLEAATLSSQRREELESNLASAHANYVADPRNETAIIWYGRRLAYLGRYREAIDVYTEGLSIHPESFRLYRHRGHRYISIREFESAIADLSRAASLVEGVPDEVEPDGAPNERNLPRSTNHSNIYYHLGLAHYLTGDFDSAAAAYESCMRFSHVNDDMLVATTYWNWMTQKRVGRDDRAAELLETIHEDMDVIENFAYRDLLLLFRGRREEADVLGGLEAGTVASPTTRYGVGVWNLVNERPDAARRIFEGIVQGDVWAAFGFIAAEAELARM